MWFTPAFDWDNIPINNDLQNLNDNLSTLNGVKSN
jgi:hypothetical protein